MSSTAAQMRAYLEAKRKHGICLRCNRPADTGVEVCAYHRQLLRKPKRCMECEQTGHNSATCPRIGGS